MTPINNNQMSEQKEPFKGESYRRGYQQGFNDGVSKVEPEQVDVEKIKKLRTFIWEKFKFLLNK